MNCLQGKVTKIKSHEGLLLIEVLVKDVRLKTIIIGDLTSYHYIRENNKIRLLFKETEVVLGRLPVNVSIQNQLKCLIKKIEKGTLLSEITLDFQGVQLSAIISSESVEKMALKQGENIVAMIKTNEIIISE